jgi:large subunit ribosomal protein L25
MTKANFELEAAVRLVQGKGASHRLRRTEDRLPAILYGGKKPPLMISLDQKKVMHALQNPAIYSHILTLNIDGEKHQAVLKAMQRHHYKKSIMHMDFLRVNPDDKINIHIPLRFLGETTCPGVKAGGIINHRMIDVEIRTIVSALPDHIDIDLSTLELDGALHLSDLKLPPNAEILALTRGENDEVVVTVHLPRKSDEDNTTAPAETAVMPKGKEAKEGKAAPAAAGKEKGKK